MQPGSARWFGLGSVSILAGVATMIYAIPKGDSSPDSRVVSPSATERVAPQATRVTATRKPKARSTPRRTQTELEQVRGGAFCATSRLGRQGISSSGAIYICKGPKPYRWRR